MSTSVELFALAWEHHQANRYAEAERLYRQIVQADPGHADAWCFLGAVVQAQGRLAEAEGHYRRAVSLLPAHPSAGNCLGITLAQQSRLQEAVACFQQFIAYWPEDADAHNNLGLVWARLGRVNDAAASYQLALRLRPDFEAARGNLNDVLRQQPHLNQPDRTSSALASAIGTMNQRGVALAQQNRIAEARDYFENALRLDPNDADAHVNLGTLFDIERRYEEAMVHYQQALQSRPDHAEGHYNLGVVLAKLARFEEAIRCYQQTLVLQPDHLDARNNLGNVLKDMGKFGEAHAAFDQALARNPDYGEGHLSRSLLLLLQGEYERGWPGYTWRWKRTGYANRTFSQPHWDGSSLEDRAILLHAEQGFGDTLHFIRYAPLVKQRGGRVIVECPKSLIPLLESAAGVDQLVASGSKLPAFDVEAALPSLPCIFRTTAATIPANVPYLQADAALVEHWRRELAPLTGFMIGIAWQGQALYPGDRLRSIPLIHFAQLAKLEGVHLVSLQKGTGTEQLRDLPGDLRVLDFGDRLDNAGAFMDTAAIMKNLDLVITSDTAIPHLAGALGVPVWLATQFVPDWRWLLEREDSPWYLKMRLFRQTRLFDWDEVFHKIGRALNNMM